MNLARRFNAGSAQPFHLVASATLEWGVSKSLLRDGHLSWVNPALKRRAKFMPADATRRSQIAPFKV